MRIAVDLGELLVGKGWLTAAQLEEARERQKERAVPIEELLLRMGAITQDQLNSAIAEQVGLPTLSDEEVIAPPKELMEKVPYSFARRHTLLPLGVTADGITVAVSDPLNLEPLEDLRMMLGEPVKALFCVAERLKTEIHRCYEEEQTSASRASARMAEKELGADGEEEVYDLFDTSREQSEIVKLLNIFLTEAIQQGASDIHFEPHESGMQVRYRIDGVLHNRHSPAAEHQAQLITRIKVMAKLDIAERRLPQDGRIKLRMGTREVDFRVSTVPTSGGERIVLRILDKGNVVLGLDRLSMPSEIDRDFRKLISLPEGIILVTGPTGSGKTTTLYSAISEIQSDETNIMTVEDPVEYKLPGIAQIGIRSKIGLTFAAGLRHILRQDPDVIMVGEIRDRETAEIAVQASLTGHLVLSTLHTNDAPSAVTRLVDMGVEPFLLSSTLVGVLAQRLVRTICPHCRVELPPTPNDLGIDQAYEGKGCSKCFGSGYSGRQGIYELMVVDAELQRQIVKSPDAIEMRRVAIENGMTSLRDHGIALAREGITSISEVLRVTRGSGIG
jgi:general secretion pathway protein E